jgi:hypothetical protein
MGSPPTPPAPPAPDQDQDVRGLAFAAERGLTGSRFIQFATRNIPPPAALYVTADDGLYINVTNIQPGQSLTFAAQFLLPDGRLQPNVWTVTPPSTGAQTAYLFQLSEGFLFNLTCVPSAVTRRGVTWIYAALRRGSLASGSILQTLIQDYVDSLSGPTWPGSQLHNSSEGRGLMTVTVESNPSAGSAVVITTPTYMRTRVCALVVKFITSAAVSNRKPYILLQDPLGPVYQDVIENTVTASTTLTLYWAIGLGWAQTAAVNTWQTRGLPDFTLNPSSTITSWMSGNDPADTATGIVLTTEQWFSA